MGRRLRWTLFGGLVGATVACTSSYGTRSTEETPMPEGGLDASTGPDGKRIVDPPRDAAADGASLLPASCADAQTKLGLSTDGNVQIDVDGEGPNPSFVVHCADMATNTPKEFLQLKNTVKTGAASSNFSMWGMGGYCDCPPNPRRYFDRVRLDLPSMSINTHDVTFATREPATPSACETNNSFCQADGAGMFFGQASSCVTNGDASGTGNVDLRGTPFHVHPTVTFDKFGSNPAGGGTPDTERKVVNLTGGGACGFVAASPAGFSQTRMKLAFDGP